MGDYSRLYRAIQRLIRSDDIAPKLAIRKALRRAWWRTQLMVCGFGRAASKNVPDLCDLVMMLLPVLPLNMLHLVLKPQFQFFQTDFF